MPKLTASKDELKGLGTVPEGMYMLRLDGFEPEYSKDRGSVNLNPVLKIINHPQLNDQRIFDNLNTKAKWRWTEFCHTFGVPLPELPSGQIEFPGDFNGPNDDPAKWQYSGPLLGQTGQVYVIQEDNTKGRMKNTITQFICKVPGCNGVHS